MQKKQQGPRPPHQEGPRRFPRRGTREECPSRTPGIAHAAGGRRGRECCPTKEGSAGIRGTRSEAGHCEGPPWLRDPTWPRRKSRGRPQGPPIRKPPRLWQRQAEPRAAFLRTVFPPFPSRTLARTSALRTTRLRTGESFCVRTLESKARTSGVAPMPRV